MIGVSPEVFEKMAASIAETLLKGIDEINAETKESAPLVTVEYVRASLVFLAGTYLLGEYTITR